MAMTMEVGNLAFSWRLLCTMKTSGALTQLFLLSGPVVLDYSVTPNNYICASCYINSYIHLSIHLSMHHYVTTSGMGLTTWHPEGRSSTASGSSSTSLLTSMPLFGLPLLMKEGKGCKTKGIGGVIFRSIVSFYSSQL